jgi:hypothetical protein
VNRGKKGQEGRAENLVLCSRLVRSCIVDAAGQSGSN